MDDKQEDTFKHLCHLELSRLASATAHSLPQSTPLSPHTTVTTHRPPTTYNPKRVWHGVTYMRSCCCCCTAAAAGTYTHSLSRRIIHLNTQPLRLGRVISTHTEHQARLSAAREAVPVSHTTAAPPRPLPSTEALVHHIPPIYSTREHRQGGEGHLGARSRPIVVHLTRGLGHTLPYHHRSTRARNGAILPLLSGRTRTSPFPTILQMAPVHQQISSAASRGRRNLHRT